MLLRGAGNALVEWKQLPIGASLLHWSCDGVRPECARGGEPKSRVGGRPSRGDSKEMKGLPV